MVVDLSVTDLNDIDGLYINGDPITVSGTEYNGSVSLGGFTVGENTVEIKAVDGIGNEVIKKYTAVRSDTVAPVLAAYMNGRDLIIEASDDVGIDEIQVDIDGDIYSYDSSDLTGGKLTIPIDLLYGDYTFKVVVSDGVNNSGADVSYYS